MKLIIESPLSLSKLQQLRLMYPLFSLDKRFYADAELSIHLSGETLNSYEDLLERGRIRKLIYTFDETEEIRRLQKQFPGLSRFQIINLYLARRENAAVLATQVLMQEAARSMGIPVFGYNWIFDQLCTHSKILPSEAVNKWQDLKHLFYPFTAQTEPVCVSQFYNRSTKREDRSQKLAEKQQKYN
ncbi:MAG: hypothetical protein IH588_14490 [Anaerolineales bacterium]|nr:hypothetical protein [Anaerolineales bacterium]